MTRICGRCKIEQPLDNFGVKTKKNGKVVLQPYCKNCNKAYHKEHYNRNKKVYLDKTKDYKKANQQRLLEYLRDKQCKDCGIKDYRVFEFDHLADKKANISAVMKSWCWETLLTEIDKCDIVCCNCHRIRTLTRSNSYRIMAD
jgi:phage terminase large subunit